MSMVKSLLTTCAVLASSLAAMAAPQVSVSYPTPGSTLDSKAYFASFNLAASGSYTVAAGASATLECLDTGDIINSTTFKDFMGAAIIVNFDTEEIVANGEYELSIPAGSVVVGGEPCAALTATYVLNDANLGIGEFPEITLVSSDPADGASVAAIGEAALNKVSFVTSNDDAVNYIGWSLYDVTNPDSPEYVYSGNENRIDLNRNGHTDDVWTNGLYITIGGPDQKLIKGQKYEMRLAFAGIGYDPVTNQYPTPTQIAGSTELETAIYFYGLTPGTEYSEYVYEEVTPDPETYIIDTVEQAMFTITYSGPVKPASFTYHRGQSDTPVAGTYSPLNDEDGDGYASMWEFIVDPSIAAGMIGEASFNIVTKDKDGLTVRGNGGYPIDDFTYKVAFECTIGYPDLISIAPAEGATVETLSEIIVGNSDDLVMAYSWNATDEPARIVDMNRNEVRVLDIPEAVEGNDKQMKWSFDPITASGRYTLIIPKWYFALGEEMDGTTTKATTFSYFVENNQSSTGATFDLTPVSVTPSDGATVTEISEVVLKFEEATFCQMDPSFPVAKLFKVDGDSETEVTQSEPCFDDGDFFNPTTYTFTFNPAVKENGTYLFKVEKASFYDETYDNEMGEAGHACPDLVYTFIIGTGLGVEAVATEAVNGNVYSVDGKVVLRNASAADVKALPAGLYIVNGKRIVVK